uniref:Uncharacterized protein n=1 Tax=Aegilops tauschii subsp. strangulata TaxID=200361 RepID=A0A453H3W7_AEGTS
METPMLLVSFTYPCIWPFLCPFFCFTLSSLYTGDVKNQEGWRGSWSIQ